jgi:hypothetical protein
MFKELKILDKTRFTTPEGLIVRIVYRNPNYLAIEDFYKENSDNESNLNPEELLIRRESLVKNKKLSSRKKL